MTAARRIAPAILAAALLTLVTTQAPAASGGDLARPGTYYLELDGSAVGALRSAEGGDPQAEEITEQGSGNKHLGAVRYSEISLEIGAGMEQATYDWLASACDFKSSRRSGALVLAGYDFSVIARKEFHDALVSEVALPALDAGSKDPAAFIVKLRPETVRLSKGAGSVSSSLASRQRPWQASNFRLEIPGLDCTRVRRIEPIRWTLGTAVDRTGQDRIGRLEPTGANVSDLQITVSEASLDSWQDWAQQFMVQGNSGDAQEKSGDLVLLGTDLQSEIARIHLSGLGIKGIQTIKTDTPGAIRSGRASLYCERASLEWKGGTGTVMNVRVFGK